MHSKKENESDNRSSSIKKVKLIFSSVPSRIYNILFYVTYLLYPVTFIIFAMSELSKAIRSQNESQKNTTTTLRKGISPNWQTFLQSQSHTKRNVDDRSKLKKERNEYYKIMRIELQNAKKANMENKISSNKNIVSNVKTKDGSPVLTRFIAMDCEMVGVGERGTENMLARVSIVNKFGDCIYDKFVKPREAVVDYRTPVSGVRREDLINAEPFDIIQKEVADLLKGRYLVGHALRNDLDVLFLSHPYSKIRDTSKYKPFRMISRGGTPSLKRLSEEFLSVNIQKGEHSSVEDARAAMQLYSLHSKHWEEMLKRKFQKKNAPSPISKQ